jgi:protein-tyrosine phosphatase
MIDLRCHILDGTPCGPDSFADSLEMCRAAIADGVRTIVATPRWEAGSSEPPLPLDECHRKLERLETETRGALSFKLGFAMQFSAHLLGLLERYGSRLALADKRHLLVSLPSVEIPAEVEDAWKSIRRGGFSVVLAHPECNTALRRNPARLARWVAEGLTLQVDAASVLGTHGREVQRFALECLRKYEGHAVVASNVCWSAGQRHSLSKALQELSGKIGARQARGFMKETPAALIGEGVRRNNVRGDSSRSLTAVLRSFGPIKALTGES